MKKSLTPKLFTLIGLCLAVYSIYFLLLRDNASPCSIYSVMHDIHHLVNHWHVLVVGLLPIYVAVVIFGLISLGLYFGTFIEFLIKRLLNKFKKA